MHSKIETYFSGMLLDTVLLQPSLFIHNTTLIIVCFSIWLKYDCLCISCRTPPRPTTTKKLEALEVLHSDYRMSCYIIWWGRPMTQYKAWHIGNGFIIHGTFLLINIKHIDLRIMSYICPDIKVSSYNSFWSGRNLVQMMYMTVTWIVWAAASQARYLNSQDSTCSPFISGW